MAMSSASNTPKSNLATPLRLVRRRQVQVPPETPDCYTKVTVETPRPARNRANKDKYDEVRNLTVAVRIRPMNTRELTHVGSTNIIEVQDLNIVVHPTPGHSILSKTDFVFGYDHVFGYCNETNDSNQQDIFLEIGQPLLHNAFRGYNACLFAYGQTGSGKSYSMMGTDIRHIDSNSNAGIIPRFCEELFTRISRLESTCTASVNVSYFEIYNEKIHDLLLLNTLKDQNTPLKVREHPDWGPYVVNLSTHCVKSYEEMRYWLALGNENRATAATTMNEKSSRSHSIFSIELSILEGTDKADPGRRSKVSLVDLAGSERLGNVNSNDEKLKQSVSINKSLLTLGKVICALADSNFVPYRESVLTWLLRESLGGNSLTCMLATITPASSHFDETLATLRYACQARHIVNRARINEEPHDRLIRELRSEVERLKTLSQEYERNSFSSSILQIDNSTEYSQEVEELRKKLNEKEDELLQAQHNWEDRYKETYQYQMQQLAEVERKKEELESRVRIMSSLETDDVNLSPYQTNFLEEMENILDSNHPDIEIAIEIIGKFRQLLNNSEFNYEVISNGDESSYTISDSKNCRKAQCYINEIQSATRRGDIKDFIYNLKWENQDAKLTESQISSAMTDIYNGAMKLRPHIEKEERLRLAFAKLIKAAQALETTLCNSINVSKSKKVVTFRL